MNQKAIEEQIQKRLKEKTAMQLEDKKKQIASELIKSTDKK